MVATGPPLALGLKLAAGGLALVEMEMEMGRRLLLARRRRKNERNER
jgi:hypothetical protein